MGKRRHAASGRLYRGCPWLRLGPQEARAAPPPASCLELFRRGRAALRQAAAALPHTWCACRAAFRQRVPVKHAADRRLRGRKVIGLPARARHDERRAPPWPVRSRAYHLKGVYFCPQVSSLRDGVRMPSRRTALVGAIAAAGAVAWLVRLRLSLRDALACAAAASEAAAASHAHARKSAEHAEELEKELSALRAAGSATVCLAETSESSSASVAAGIATRRPSARAAQPVPSERVQTCKLGLG